jgi:hypothetical protein
MKCAVTTQISQPFYSSRNKGSRLVAPAQVTRVQHSFAAAKDGRQTNKYMSCYTGATTRPGCLLAILVSG